VKSIHLLVVGKNKDLGLLQFEEDFLKRIKTVNFLIHEVRAKHEDVDLEAKEILSKISLMTKKTNALIILLMERGIEYSSEDFSHFIFNKSLTQYDDLIFCIGGAAGFGDEILNLYPNRMSLSKMTFPHRLVRSIFIEQVYRAVTIWENHPYHKGFH
jgi:23S rRNA (pseudouridine1915-N3)-methyltransferase